MKKKYDVLANVKRLAIMRDLALLDAPEEPFFDRLTDLASNVIGVPVSLVTLVSGNYQFFKSMVGLPDPWATNRRTPLSHSFCQHVVGTGEALIVEDARDHEILKDNMAIPDLNVVGYLGMPLKTSNGNPLGSFCVIDSQPHAWTEQEIEIMQTLADLVNAEIDARVRARDDGRLKQYIAKSGRRLSSFLDEIEPDIPVDTLLEKLRTFAAETRS